MQIAFHHKKLFICWGFIFTAFFFLSLWYQIVLLAFIPFVLLTIPLVIAFPGLLFYALVIFLPLSVEYKFTDTLGSDLPDEFLMISITGVFFLLMAYNPLLIRKNYLNHPLILILLLHIGWIIITLIYSTNVVLSLKYLAAKTWYIIPFVLFLFLVVKNKRSFVAMSACLILPMLFVVLQSLFRHLHFGFSFEKINNTLSPYFRNHVNYGAMLVCLLPVVLAWVQLSDSRSIKFLAILIFLVFLTGVFFSYSRGAWLAIFVALITAWMIRKRIMHWFFLGGVLAAMFGSLWLANDNRYLDYRPDFRKTIFHKDFREHMAATYRGRDLSTAERFYRWTAAKKMISARPLLGVGPNNFYDNYKPYATAAYKTWVSDNREHSTVHNYFLLLLTEQGIPGLLIFGGLLYGMFWYAQHIYNKQDSPFYKTITLAIASILSMIVTVNFLSDLIETDKVGSLFFLCFGLLIVLDVERKGKVILRS